MKWHHPHLNIRWLNPYVRNNPNVTTFTAGINRMKSVHQDFLFRTTGIASSKWSKSLMQLVALQGQGFDYNSSHIYCTSVLGIFAYIVSFNSFENAESSNMYWYVNSADKQKHLRIFHSFSTPWRFSSFLYGRIWI